MIVAPKTILHACIMIDDVVDIMRLILAPSRSESLVLPCPAAIQTGHRGRPGHEQRCPVPQSSESMVDWSGCRVNDVVTLDCAPAPPRVGIHGYVCCCRCGCYCHCGHCVCRCHCDWYTPCGEAAHAPSLSSVRSVVCVGRVSPRVHAPHRLPPLVPQPRSYWY